MHPYLSHVETERELTPILASAVLAVPFESNLSMFWGCVPRLRVHALLRRESKALCGQEAACLIAWTSYDCSHKGKTESFR